MKKAGIIFIFFCVMAIPTWGQLSVEKIAELKNQLQSASHDTIRLGIYVDLANGYRYSNLDSSNFYADQVFISADKLNKPLAKSLAIGTKSSNALESGNLPQSFQFALEALKIAEKIKDNPQSIGIKGSNFNRIGNIYMELANYRKAIDYYRLSKESYQNSKVDKINNVLSVKGDILNEVSNIGNVYQLMGMADSALYYQHVVYDTDLKMIGRNSIVRGEMMGRMGNAYKLKGDNEKALWFYRKGINEANFDNDRRDLAMNNLSIAKLYFEMSLPDSSIKYTSNAIKIAQTIYLKKVLYEAYLLISEIFKTKKDFESAYKYLSLANVQRNSLTGAKKLQDLQRIILNEQERHQKENELKVAEQNRNRLLVLVASAAVLLFIAFVFYRSNRQKRKANKVLEKTLRELKSTQTQLIQKEKLASLGELTAGIAHEIQNPLNFVNNFSEVSTELVTELEEEQLKPNRDTDLEAELLVDLKQNLQKITHHGGRASAIVRGMLEHSRTSTGEKRLTDLNALVDEYLKLAYHGLKAKDKDFNAEIRTNFGSEVGLIEVVPQEIGRVLLNLYNNAFYAVQQRDKGKGQAETYQPMVSVSTSQLNGHTEIRVSDNGTGISESVKAKIFQPFFTTKPTGEGTGLGLSLSYDIVTKGHGGSLTMESHEGKGTTFLIQLPTAKAL